jgi:hypothetical protein
MKRRRVTEEEIIDAIRHPENIVKKYGEYYFRKNIGRGTIEIAAERTERYIRIITLYWI